MAAPPAAEPAQRVLVACVGNSLRGDDGFGIAVAAELHTALPAGVELIETGIGGLGIVHALMDGYDALVIVDAVERAASPGTVFVLIPQVPHVDTPTFDEWRAQLADLHLAEPSRVLRIARAAGVLPPQVFVVGCQPQTCEDFEEGLSHVVAEAVPVAARHVRRLVDDLLSGALRAGAVASAGVGEQVRCARCDLVTHVDGC
ncbi:MAG: hydrogenase maturation protease [Actinobacteria bacterium]|nr:hydrogenase maturation protease [Actinomycetota bacterium]